MQESYFNHRKHLFSIPQNTLYFCGHSLGPCSIPAKQALQNAQSEWEQHIVSAWHDADWLSLPTQLGKQIALLIGAQPDEVMVCDSTSVNLYKALFMALSVQKTRRVILSTTDNFPTDLYIADQVASLKNIEVRKTHEADIIDAINEQVGVIMITQVNYRTGQKMDIEAITKKAHHHGAVVVLDLSHSVGAMPIACSKLKIDFAVGCTYKYLNGGPGSPSFIYINQRHHHLNPALVGWMGHHDPFAFSNQYVPHPGIQAQKIGTPTILSLQALSGALSIFSDLDLMALHQKSHAMGNHLIEVFHILIPELKCISPTPFHSRGNHIGFLHKNAKAISEQCIRHHIVVDFRAPDLIRFGINPLYLDFDDFDRLTKMIQKIRKLYENID